MTHDTWSQPAFTDDVFDSMFDLNNEIHNLQTANASQLLINVGVILYYSSYFFIFPHAVATEHELTVKFNNARSSYAKVL